MSEPDVTDGLRRPGEKEAGQDSPGATHPLIRREPCRTPPRPGEMKKKVEIETEAGGEEDAEPTRRVEEAGKWVGGERRPT
jgi:hypothetical protein